MAKNPVTLEDILLPGTPTAVRERYETLAARAQERDFGLLETDVVVLDTETTGLSFRNCELIQISAARLVGGRIDERYDTFVHPSGPIPPEIIGLTGIRDLDVMDAPRALEAVAGLAEFVGGMPVIAHNASFDRTFVEAVPGGHEVSDLWLDSLALSRIALPRLSTHRLADMAQAFGCASVTHRATDDVDALAGMWRVILTALTDLPAGLLAHLADMHPEVAWSFRPVMARLAAEGAPEPFSLKQVRHELVEGLAPHVRADASGREATLTPIDERQVRSAFAPGGPISRMYASYETRPEQLAMALEVNAALATSTHRAVEAGTGVGKSVAYLLPSILYARANDLTVGVATKTNALTDQLVSQELPALAEVLPGGFTWASLKGYDHYPCLRRLELAASAAELPTQLVESDGRSEAGICQDMLTALAVTYAYVCQSPEGDLDALGIRWRYVPRQMLATSPRECQRHRCPFFPNECLLHGARRRAAAADIVVTNHSLLLRNVMAEGKILPPIRHWVIDEAHAFEAEARRQWAVEVSASETRAGFETLGGMHAGTIHALMVQSNALEGATLCQRLLTKAAASVSRAQVATSDFFVALHELGSVERGGAGYDGVSVWIGSEVRATPAWNALAVAADAAVERLGEAAKDVAEAAGALADASAQLGATLADAGGFLSALRDGIALIVDGTDESYVYSAQLTRRKRDMGSERLVAEKVDVGADLASLWLPEMSSVIFSSATIAVGESFEHFEQAVGLSRLPQGSSRSVRLDSSFDFDRHMAVVVCRDLPAPNDPRYLAALEDLLFDVHVSMGGSVLTLFTNRREMEQVANGLVRRLSAVGIELVWQERGSSPRRLRERFLADERLSLMALKTFWEGFDAAGDTLRCVVIPKLPFANPRDPLVRERELRDQRSWWKHSLPEAVISVKQAAGRLIRTSSDTGVLVLADSRLTTKRYGQQFVQSMPSHTVATLGKDQVGRYIEMWRKSH